MNRYQYNGKELNSDLGLGWNDYGARWYDAAVGRWNAVDPLADEAPDWTPYRYAFDNPLIYIDPDGLFEDEAAAKAYAKENGIKTGWLRSNKIKKQSDGSYAIENRKEHTSKSRVKDDEGNDLGVMTATMVAATDVMEQRLVSETGIFESKIGVENVLRDGTVEFVPAMTGTAPTPGKILKSVKFLKELPALDNTGKLHGTLPKIKDLSKYTKDELTILLNDLKQSVQNRIKSTSLKGPRATRLQNRQHGQRQGAEQDLIKTIEKILEK